MVEMTSSQRARTSKKETTCLCKEETSAGNRMDKGWDCCDR